MDFTDTDSLVGRLGLRVARTWANDAAPEPLKTTGWARLNLSHEFMDNPTTTFSSDDGPVAFQADLGAYWLELNGGFTKQMSGISALYGNLGYQRNLDNDGHAWTGQLGVRFNW